MQSFSHLIESLNILNLHRVLQCRHAGFFLEHDRRSGWRTTHGGLANSLCRDDPRYASGLGRPGCACDMDRLLWGNP
jgi:hypothetical protein